MKKIYTLFLALIFTGSLMAQTPQSFKYQAVARDASGDVVAGQAVGMQISILQGSTSGTAVYVETFTPTTNEFGLINLNIGAGTVASGDLTTIDWSADTYFIKIEMDITGGTTYEEYGTSQLLSVPYALHAKTAANTFSGNYSDLSGAPINVSTFTNDAGYLTSISETDPVFTAWDKTSGISITESQISDLDHFTTTDETDPIFGTSIASGITGTDTTNWNNKLDSYTEADPIYGASVASGIAGTDTTYWNNKLDSYTETDPTIDQNFDFSSISKGNILRYDGNKFIKSSDVLILSTAEIAALTPEAGQSVYNNTENLYQIYSGSGWISIPLNCWPEPSHAIAGTNQSFTDLTTSTTLEANTPETGHGTGQWSILSGDGGNFDDIYDPNTVFAGTECTNYTLQWEISTACNQSTDNVNISFYATPTTANAGADQSFADFTTSTTLEANTPETEYCTGQWSIVSGDGGNFDDINDPNTIFTGAECTNYTLQWEISTVCDQSTDNVNISYYATPITANAGDDIFSPEQTTVTLNANNPTIGTGSWSVVSGTGGSFSNPDSYNSNFTGNDNETYILRWTITTACASSYAELNVFIGNVIGQFSHGGVVFYVDETGEHGLVCAINDQSDGIKWRNESSIETGATGTEIGTGQGNTTTIVTIQGEGSYAAQLCDDLSLNGYDDWFLPSKDELNAMYQNKTIINDISIANGGTALNSTLNEWYWSSSEYDAWHSHCQHFGSGTPQSLSTKIGLLWVRAVRAF